MIYKNIQKNRGYTLLFAVMVSSLVLAVGISILNISKKEFLLSSSARESITAFYSADSALECAVYFDNMLMFTEESKLKDVKCIGNEIQYDKRGGPFDPSYIKYDIGLIPDANNNDIKKTITTCAIVERLYDSRTSKVEFISRGYNMGWNGSKKTCSDSSPRRVERAIYYSYTTN